MLICCTPELELDYVGEQIHSHNGNREAVSLLEFHFETEDCLDYSMQQSELKDLLSSILQSRSGEIKTDGNDIMVYL